MTRTFRDLVERSLTPQAEKIRRTTSPLHCHLGIEYFTYHFVTPEGGYGAIVDRMDVAEHYVEQKVYLVDPYLTAPHTFRQEIHAWSHRGSEAYRNRLQGAQEVGVDDGIMWICPTADGSVEFFGISSKQKTTLPLLAYNHRELLRRFFRYFREEFAPLITALKADPISLPKVKGDRYSGEGRPTEPNISAFAASLGIRSFAPLSRRERECLRLYREGYTASETASRLGLSPRTVESYLESLKNKLGCVTKRDLLDYDPSWLP